MVIPGSRLLLYLGLSRMLALRFRITLSGRVEAVERMEFSSLEELERGLEGLGGGKAFLVLSSRYVFSMVLEYPRAVKKRLNQVLSLELWDKVPYPLEEVYWGYWTYEEGDTLKVVVSFALREELDPLLNLLDSKGWRVGGVFPSSFCLYLRAREGEPGIYVLDDTRDELDGLVFRGGLGTRPAPRRRERLSMATGGEDLEVVDLSKDPSGVLLPLVERVIKREVQEPLPHLGPGKVKLERVIPGGYLVYFLLPVLLLVLSLWFRHELHLLTREKVTLQREVKELEEELSRAEGSLDRANRKRMLAGRLTEFKKEGVHPLVLLGKLTELVPRDSYLTYLDLGRGRVRMKGKSVSTLEMVKKLESSGLFRDCRLISLTRGRGNERERFYLEASVVGGEKFSGE